MKKGGGKMENIMELINREWRKNYIALTARCVAETFFVSGAACFYKCSNCAKVVMTTKDIIKLAENRELLELKKSKITNIIKLGRGGLVICYSCYKKIKEQLRFAANKRKLLECIRLEIVETASYKRARAKAYRLLEKMLSLGMFRYKQKDGRQNLYYF
jgi:hypothetical protein